jgi:hypothetical protein
MARRTEPFVRELSDGEAARLLRLARRSRNPAVQHRAMLLFASFQGQSSVADCFVGPVRRYTNSRNTYLPDCCHAPLAGGSPRFGSLSVYVECRFTLSRPSSAP